MYLDMYAIYGVFTLSIWKQCWIFTKANTVYDENDLIDVKDVLSKLQNANSYKS